MENFKIITAFVLALVCLCAFSYLERTNTLSVSVEAVSDESTVAVADEEAEQNTESNGSDDGEITVAVNLGSRIEDMTSDEYIFHVLAGEVSPSYEPEALKAQAVAARTYLLYKKAHGGCANGGDICIFSNHCQAYKTDEQIKSAWGEMYDEYAEKLRKAVSDTKNEVIKYNGQLICALYHSSSVGCTENCADVFGGSYPYLASVSTPLEKSDGEYVKSVSLTKSDIGEKLGITVTESDTVTITEKTESGRVKTVRIGEKTVQATALRRALNLRSTDFTVKDAGANTEFTCYGYGHGVGMSQHGANIMAANGQNYIEILCHYYSGVEITAA